MARALQIVLWRRSHHSAVGVIWAAREKSSRWADHFRGEGVCLRGEHSIAPRGSVVAGFPAAQRMHPPRQKGWRRAGDGFLADRPTRDRSERGLCRCHAVTQEWDAEDMEKNERCWHETKEGLDSDP